MRVLIIEDQQEKYSALQGVLKHFFGAEVHWVRTISNSLSILGQGWDLILLDMNFPTAGGLGRESGRMETSGARVMQVMTSNNIQVPVIIATAHDSFGDNRSLKISSMEELTARMSRAFPGLFRGAVKVNSSDDTWHQTLIELVRKATA